MFKGLEKQGTKGRYNKISVEEKAELNNLSDRLAQL